MKIALISGSSRGIGKAITKLLLNNKWRVYGFSRNNNITHPNFYHKTVDLANLKSFNTIKFPEIKTDDTILLINNASIIGNITQLDKKLAKEICSEYNLNIISPTIMCGKFLAKYQYNNKIIFNISSGAAQHPISSWGTYCSSKAALEMLTKVIEKEKYKNLRIFSISPGVVNTDMQKEIRETSKLNFPIVKKFQEYHQNNELEKPDNIAKKIYHIIQNLQHFTQNHLYLRDIQI